MESVVICSVLTEEGRELVEPEQIRRRAVGFYSSLFHSDYKDNESPFGEYCGGLFQAEAVHHSTSRSYATSMTTSTGTGCGGQKLANLAFW